MSRLKPKIAFIGGGSSKFIREMAVDLFSYEALKDIQITLMDIDRERVERSERLVRRIIREMGVTASVESTLSQRAALDGADYVIVTVMVGGLKHYKSDTEIPCKYGVYPTVGDTIGPGAVFRTIRTAPVLQSIVNDLKELAPDAWLLNYANPMAMNMGAIRDSGHTRAVGLCHSIQGSYRHIAQRLGVPADDVTYTAAGINHINFYLKLEYKGRDLYPSLLAARERLIADDPQRKVWFDQIEYLGHITAEGPCHQLEYYPWFRKNLAQIDEYAVETGWGYKVDSEMMKSRGVEAEQMISGTMPIKLERSLEYGSRIVESLQTGTVRTFYGNVPNAGLIDNLPPNAIVEVPCMVDANGIWPCHAGTVPPQLAAVMTPHIAVHQMAVQGTFAKDRRMIHYAVQADPLTAAVCTLPQVRSMVDELFDENGEYVKDWPNSRAL